MVQKDPFENIIHQSRVMSELISLARKVAQSDAVVLITGESGTGKELFASAIHRASPRAQGKFVALNCAAVPETLLEAELFGHERGAFTGAIASRKGRFEQAHGGSLFLDEIGDMSLTAQAKILRVIEERTVERIGGQTSIPVDIRIITATNQPLRENVQRSQFRSDLYYRLNEVRIDIPPLRERREDIALLVKHFIDQFNRQYDKRIRGCSDAAMEFLCRHHWPGNIRELQNVVKCAVLVAEGDLLWLEHIPVDIHNEMRQDRTGEPVATTRADSLLEIMSLEEMEKRHILRILESTGWNKSQSSQILKISRPTLDRKIDRYGLEAMAREARTRGRVRVREAVS